MQKKEIKFIAGIDVSKKTFDISVGSNEPEAKVTKAHFVNNLKGYDGFTSWLKEQDIVLKNTLFCLENTGIYHRLLVQFLQSKKASVWVETPVQIKWSLGIQRGKNDSVDSERIMIYAFRNQDKAKIYETKHRILQQIADYLSLRSRLKDCVKALKMPVKSFCQ